ncbi:MAG TPA: hypothetical protein GXX29_04645 [Firmicutes bacterium]|nr:hypothetical protein [Bacillota bacterium]
MPLNTAVNEERSARERVLTINQAMEGVELFSGARATPPPGQNSTFRLAPEPFFADEQLIEELSLLGEHFLAFLKAADHLYLQSRRQHIPAFFHEYLDQGKPEQVLDFARQKRFRRSLPLVIRPDILLTEEGPVVTELDAVPGGMGLLDFLSRQYAAMGYRIVGGPDGLAKNFAAALTGLCPEVVDPLAAVVVSDESGDFRGEMQWLAQQMQSLMRICVCHPRDLLFIADALYLDVPVGAAGEKRRQKVDILYRFFELFDLKNIPQIDLILYAARKEMAAFTPPVKAHLEEKSLFALLHHPVLQHYWAELLGDSRLHLLKKLLPETWILDPRPLPPQAVIPGLSIGGRPLTDFRELGEATQKERQLVIKPSGFSPLAWGSRGVVIGADHPSEVWAKAIEDALASFSQVPHILQRFHKSKRVKMPYYDFTEGAIKIMQGRVRLCPYYFVHHDQAHLSGVLATIVPLDKKAIHGMVDAVMVPVALRR